MSQNLIHQYLNELADIRKLGARGRETSEREAFKDLLKSLAKSHDLKFQAEYPFETPAKDKRSVDGAVLYPLRVPFGYWEAKDEKDDLNEEIDRKLRRGYPKDNIIFEDGREAVLLQDGKEIIRTPVEDVTRLERLLNLFFSYQRSEIGEFRSAVEKFKTDLPAVLETLREMIASSFSQNSPFRAGLSRPLLNLS